MQQMQQGLQLLSGPFWTTVDAAARAELSRAQTTVLWDHKNSRCCSMSWTVESTNYSPLRPPGFRSHNVQTGCYTPSPPYSSLLCTSWIKVSSPILTKVPIHIIQFNSVPRPIWLSGQHNGQFSRIFSTGGHCEQFWHRQRLMLSIQHFLCWPQHRPHSRLSWRMVLEWLS